MQRPIFDEFCISYFPVNLFVLIVFIYFECNFIRYCKKQRRFETLGDFSKEEAGICDRNPNISTVPEILRGLLVPQLVPQIKVSKEYSDKWQYFDRTSNYLCNLQASITLFEQYSTKKFYPWQYAVLSMIMEQDDRKVRLCILRILGIGNKKS